MDKFIHFDHKQDALVFLVGSSIHGLPDDADCLIELLILNADQKGRVSLAEKTAGRGDLCHAEFPLGQSQ